MITIDDAGRTLEFKDYYIIQPDFHFWKKRYNDNGGYAVPEDFEYKSNTNPWLLTKKGMKEIIQIL